MKLLSVLFICTATLLSLTTSVSAQSTETVAVGRSAYSILNRRGGGVKPTVSIQSVFNLNPDFSTYPLRAELWLGRDCYNVRSPRNKQVRVVGKNFGYGLQPYQESGALFMSSGFRKVKPGRYRVSVVIMDEARSGIYGGACFSRKITVK